MFPSITQDAETRGNLLIAFYQTLGGFSDEGEAVTDLVTDILFALEDPYLLDTVVETARMHYDESILEKQPSSNAKYRTVDHEWAANTVLSDWDADDLIYELMGAPAPNPSGEYLTPTHPPAPFQDVHGLVIHTCPRCGREFSIQTYLLDGMSDRSSASCPTCNIFEPDAFQWPE